MGDRELYTSAGWTVWLELALGIPSHQEMEPFGAEDMKVGLSQEAEWISLGLTSPELSIAPRSGWKWGYHPPWAIIAEVSPLPGRGCRTGDLPLHLLAQLLSDTPSANRHWSCSLHPVSIRNVPSSSSQRSALCPHSP